MADAGDLKSPVRNGRVGSTPTSATTFYLYAGLNIKITQQSLRQFYWQAHDVGE